MVNIWADFVELLHTWSSGSSEFSSKVHWYGGFDLDLNFDHKGYTAYDQISNIIEEVFHTKFATKNLGMSVY